MELSDAAVDERNDYRVAYKCGRKISGKHYGLSFFFSQFNEVSLLLVAYDLLSNTQSGVELFCREWKGWGLEVGSLRALSREEKRGVSMLLSNLLVRANGRLTLQPQPSKMAPVQEETSEPAADAGGKEETSASVALVTPPPEKTDSAVPVQLPGVLEDASALPSSLGIAIAPKSGACGEQATADHLASLGGGAPSSSSSSSSSDETSGLSLGGGAVARTGPVVTPKSFRIEKYALNGNEAGGGNQHGVSPVNALSSPAPFQLVASHPTASVATRHPLMPLLIADGGSSRLDAQPHATVAPATAYLRAGLEVEPALLSVASVKVAPVVDEDVGPELWRGELELAGGRIMQVVFKDGTKVIEVEASGPSVAEPYYLELVPSDWQAFGFMGLNWMTRAGKMDLCQKLSVGLRLQHDGGTECLRYDPKSPLAPAPAAEKERSAVVEVNVTLDGGARPSSSWEICSPAPDSLKLLDVGPSTCRTVFRHSIMPLLAADEESTKTATAAPGRKQSILSTTKADYRGVQAAEEPPLFSLASVKVAPVVDEDVGPELWRGEIALEGKEHEVVFTDAGAVLEVVARYKSEEVYEVELGPTDWEALGYVGLGWMTRAGKQELCQKLSESLIVIEEDDEKFMVYDPT